MNGLPKASRHGAGAGARRAVQGVRIAGAAAYDSTFGIGHRRRGSSAVNPRRILYSLEAIAHAAPKESATGAANS